MQEAGAAPEDAAPKDYSRAKRLVQRARQDAALKVLQKVGYTVDFTGESAAAAAGRHRLG